MKVLQVNVRLQEGGAARIAMDLHQQLLSRGIESRFAYGWGERGGRSTAENLIPNSFQVGQQWQVAGNMLSHYFIGIDCISPIGAGRKRLIDSIHWADVIHLHVVHSYFLPFSWLVAELHQAGKPVVMTTHDYWLATGRCASAEGCDGWKRGCGCCPTKNSYPTSLLDFSGEQFKSKREGIAKLGKQLMVISPSRFVGEVMHAALPDIEVKTIHNWVDTDFEQALTGLRLEAQPVGFLRDVIKVGVVANDLSDPAKVDINLLNQLLNMSHIELHMIGHNSPISGRQVVNYGRVSGRTSMVEVMSSMDVALFTSEKDTFGLVMIEALACGVPVLAVESKASREVLSEMGIQPVVERAEIIAYLRDKKLPECYRGVSRKSLRDEVLERFTKQTAIDRYISVYAEAMERVCG